MGGVGGMGDPGIGERGAGLRSPIGRAGSVPLRLPCLWGGCPVPARLDGTRRERDPPYTDGGAFSGTKFFPVEVARIFK